jgi:hypothetical protein
MIKPLAALLLLTSATTSVAWAQTTPEPLTQSQPQSAAAPVAAETPTPTPATPPAMPLPRVDAVFAADGVTITDGSKSVLFYRTAPADPREPGRLNYVHPLYAPDGAVLTQDRPADHLHQRGVFWSWHQVIVDGKAVADGWFMKGLAFHVREKRFKGDRAAGGTLTVNADWIVNSGPEVAYVARETTKVKVFALKKGARRIDFDTVITARADTLALGGSDDAKGYGGFSVRLVQPDRLAFGSAGKAVVPAVGPIEAGKAMGLRLDRSRRSGLDGGPGLQGQRYADHPLDPAQGTVDAELRLPRPRAVRAQEGPDPAPAVDPDPAPGHPGETERLGHGRDPSTSTRPARPRPRRRPRPRPPRTAPSSAAPRPTRPWTPRGADKLKRDLDGAKREE